MAKNQYVRQIIKELNTRSKETRKRDAKRMDEIMAQVSEMSSPLKENMFIELILDSMSVDHGNRKAA